MKIRDDQIHRWWRLAAASEPKLANCDCLMVTDVNLQWLQDQDLLQAKWFFYCQINLTMYVRRKKNRRAEQVSAVTDEPTRWAVSRQNCCKESWMLSVMPILTYPTHLHLVPVLGMTSVSWSLTSLFSTNMAISEMKGQEWKVIRTQWTKASDILTSTLAAFLFSSHP